MPNQSYAQGLLVFFVIVAIFVAFATLIVFLMIGADLKRNKIGEKARLTIYSVMGALLVAVPCMFASLAQKEFVVLFTMLELFWLGHLALMIIAFRLIVIVAAKIGGDYWRIVTCSALVIIGMFLPIWYSQGAFDDLWITHVVTKWLFFVAPELSPVD